MPWLSRLSRLTLACLCLCAGAWVAMPAVQLLLGDGGPDRVEPPRGATLERRTSEPPRHVIREQAPEPRSEEPIRREAFETSAPPADIGLSHPPATSPPLADPLPPLPPAFSGRPPGLDAMYRSTVEMPPPPLLDVHAPPPLSAALPRPDSRPRGGEIRPSAGVPRHYVVRDGDDLTGIALRFYGNPAAAEAIWSANRDRLADPKILPIGLALQLPPAGSAGVPSGQRERVIEPL